MGHQLTGRSDGHHFGFGYQTWKCSLINVCPDLCFREPTLTGTGQEDEDALQSREARKVRLKESYRFETFEHGSRTNCEQAFHEHGRGLILETGQIDDQLPGVYIS